MGPFSRTLSRAILLVVAGVLLLAGLIDASQAGATRGLLQTVVTATPRATSSPEAAPDTTGGETTQPSGTLSSDSGLVIGQQVSRGDVLPGEELEFFLWVENASLWTVSDISLHDTLDRSLIPVQIGATQGTVEVEAQDVNVALGTLQPGQGALIVITVRVAEDAVAGQVFLNQYTVRSGGWELQSEPVAAALPPRKLPATGSNRPNP